MKKFFVSASIYLLSQKLKYINPIWWCYYVTIRFEAPCSKESHVKLTNTAFESGKKIRLLSKHYGRYD